MVRFCLKVLLERWWSKELFCFFTWSYLGHTGTHRYPQCEHLSTVNGLWREWEWLSGVLSDFDLWYVLNVGVRDNRLGAGRVEETWRECGEGAGADRHDGHTGSLRVPIRCGKIFMEQIPLSAHFIPPPHSLVKFVPSGLFWWSWLCG